MLILMAKSRTFIIVHRSSEKSNPVYQIHEPTFTIFIAKDPKIKTLMAVTTQFDYHPTLALRFASDRNIPNSTNTAVISSSSIAPLPSLSNFLKAFKSCSSVYFFDMFYQYGYRVGWGMLLGISLSILTYPYVPYSMTRFPSTLYYGKQHAGKKYT